jgi:hypothetical protein
MKIAEMREGQRVSWCGIGGEVLYVQPADVAADLAAEDAAATAARDSLNHNPIIATPDGPWDGLPRAALRVLVRLDHDAPSRDRRTYIDGARHLWCTPSPLRPEADDE